MTEEFNNSQSALWIEKANTIRTSGRWADLNKQIARLDTNEQACADHFEDNDARWMLIVFASLCFQVLQEYKALRKAYDNKTTSDVSEVAWRTRNLLELFIWSGYCSIDKAHARRFYEDAGRDMIGLVDNFTKWGHATEQDADWLKMFSDSKERLKSEAAIKGVSDLDDAYKEVREAAKEIGYEAHFRTCNRTLSKFAHPTALLVFRPINAKLEQQLKEEFYGQACMFFCGAFDVLEISLLGPSKEAA